MHIVCKKCSNSFFAISSQRVTVMNIYSSMDATTHARLTALFPGLPRKAKPIWILLKQETVSGSGSGISWAVCKSAPRSRQITTPAPHHSFFYRPDALPAAQPTVSKHWRLIIVWYSSATLLGSDLLCASVAMDSPSSSPAKEESCTTAAAADAEPCPRFVTNEELHILQTCLTRWRTEVEQDIRGIVFIHAVIFMSVL